MSNTLPNFQTARLTLRRRTVADIDACLAMDRDPDVTRFVAGPWIHSGFRFSDVVRADPAAHKAFVEERMNAAYPAGMGYWSVLASHGFIGWILLIPLSLRGPEIEIGWRFVRAAWGRGYATEAARPVLDHALTTLRLPQVVADIDPANTTSVGVARKLGFHILGPIEYAGRVVNRYVANAVGAAQ